jgi:eukaryotic-like serine/threonine-protein kinase
MGEVYRARDDRLGRDVAIKILPASFAADADRLTRFEQEARAAGALNHPNILAIYDTGTHDDSPFVVSELLEGETLRDHLSGSALSQRNATDYGLQLAHGLSAAHEKGIVHRDLKPENIFITSDGRIKILDFGLAKLVEHAAGAGAATALAPTRVNTEPGTVMGTVGYMSPEQVRGQETDHRSDIFSMGVVLHEMLSGKRLFRGDSAVETMNAILKEEPPALSESGQPISPGLQRIVDHCLEKSAARRFQSARDLAFALEAFSGSGVSAASSGAGVVASRAPFSIRERLPWLIAAVMTIGLLASLPLAVANFRRVPIEERAVRFAIPLPETATSPYFDVVTNSLSLSPDGRYLAFVAISEGQRRLWLRPIGALMAQVVPGSDGARSPFWSPDSRFIAFFAGGKLKRIEPSGASPQTICDVSGENETTGTWGRDGVILYTNRVGNDYGLFRVGAAGGVPTLLTKRPGDQVFAWPHVLPDARHFLFYEGTREEPTKRGIYVASLDSNETRLVVPTPPTQVAYAAGYLLYAREGSIVAQPFDAKTLQVSGEPLRVVERATYFDKTGWSGFSVSDNGVFAYMPELPPTQLAWVDRAGRETGRIGAPALWGGLRISADGRKLAVSQKDRHILSGEIWIHELERGTSTRFALGPADNGNPVWSPDGKRIAFFRCCDNPSMLRIKDVADPGTGATPLRPGFQFPVDWSPDGRFILFGETDSTGGSDLWLLPMNGDRKATRFLQTPFQEMDARFSPDGRWVAYSSTETTREEIYVTRFDRPGEKWRVSIAGGRNPRWRRDGKELFFRSANDDIMAAAVKGR